MFNEGPGAFENLEERVITKKKEKRMKKMISSENGVVSIKREVLIYVKQKQELNQKET